ncbi:MAG: class I SAM-dependent methyltransferase [bacterium]|nr:class I SAM-dependent methyltransferase [bacterium]
MASDLKQDWENVWNLEEFREVDERSLVFGIVNSILARYPKGSMALDAGSGLGQWVFYFERLGYKGYGIDIVKEAVKRCLAKAEAENSGSDFRVGDIRQMPFEDDFFDAIVSFGAIEHFPETEKAIAEIYRVLKNSGTALITVPNVFSIRTLITRPILNILKTPQFGYQGYEKSYRPKQLAKMMERAGFKHLKCGILPDGVLLGDFYRFLPFLGKSLGTIARKISFWIEKRQNILGHMAYCRGIKDK